MLFHSPEFVFAFLPACLAGVLAMHRLAGWDGAVWFLIGASFVFYGQWGIELAALLLGSILCNFAAARAIQATLDRGRTAKVILLGAIGLDLSLLAYFKYTNFFIDNINLIIGAGVPHLEILLPVGISFYTFIQIGFLIEVYTRQVESFRFSHFMLIGSFFPCVTAGPILLQKDMLPQLSEQRPFRIDFARITVGFTVFAIGLAKKLLLADNIAPYADAVFDGVAAGGVAGAETAWIGSLAYTLQLYFDFSGYSDMALGLGHAVGLSLPINFSSPLKATSISDFWRRWHMTMTRFFTNYLYSPLAMKAMRHAMRRGHGRPWRFLLVTAIPVIWTFVLAGLWHGAGWNFVIFGLIHGVALAVNHGWRDAGMPRVPAPGGWLLTVLVVIVGLVFFRADSVPSALALLASMLGLGAGVGPAAAVLIQLDVAAALVWIAVLGALVVAAPNTQQIMRNHWYSSDPASEDEPSVLRWTAWRPSVGWAIAGALLLAAALGSLSGDTAFLYYKF